jgi:hypothetical protein
LEKSRKQHHHKEINWKLRNERSSKEHLITGFPLSSRIKPTKHPQFCYGCGKGIEKNEQQLVLESGMWGRAAEGNDNGRIPVRSISASDKSLRHVTGIILTQRFLYFHPKCFSCFMNKMSKNIGIPALMNESTCTDCSERFTCYTDIPELQYRERFAGVYRPSKPPMLKEEE